MIVIDVKKIILISTTVFTMIMSLFVMTGLSAEELKNQSDSEIVFVLDVSNSMNTTDKEYLAVDSIKQMISVLPQSYSVGLVTYGTTVQNVVALSTDRTQIMMSLPQVRYKGYTDAGSGLEKAVELFTPNSNINKTIVLISDGEITSTNNQATLDSLNKFNNAIQSANQQGIKIYTIALGGRENIPQNNIYNQNVQDSQKIYEAQTAESLSEIANKIIFDELDIAKCSVGMADSATGTINIKIPTSDVETVKILIHSTLPIYDLTADYNSLAGNINTGKRFATLEITRPEQQEVAVHFTTVAGNKVYSELIQEVKAKFKTKVSYPNLNKKLAEIKIIPVSNKNEEILLFKNSYFENKNVQVIVDGQPLMAKIKNGAIIFTIDSADKTNVKVAINCKDLNVNLIGSQEISVDINQSNLQPLIFGLILIAVFIIIYLVKQRRKESMSESLPYSTRYEFAGKLNIYITRAPDDTDIPPQVYNLYRLFSKKEITLAQILENCGIKLVFEGADKITLNPGANRALILTNQSDCTILKNRELIIKNHSYLLYFEEKVTISFEDEKSELVFHYKNVKPSEKK